jgi:glycosyltransferase involved in cell wall biosynthesis
MGTIRVAQLITTLARGGAQATVMASRQLDHEGIEVTVLAGGEDPGEGTYWPELAGDWGHPGDGSVVAVPSLRRSVAPLDDARALAWVIRWLRTERPDVIHTHSAKAGLIGRLAAAAVGIPAVHTVHGWSFAAPRGETSVGSRAARRATVSLERALAVASKALVVVSPLDAELGLAMNVGSIEQYHVIRSGIDLDQPRAGRRDRRAIRHELGWGPDEAIVGSVGRLAAQKDLSTLLTGFARADVDARLVLIGDGPDRPMVETLAADLGIAHRVELLGSRPDAARLVAGFDVFALTSRWEGLPRALVEAMAAEVPVVTTPVGGIPELVEDGRTGLVVAVGEPEAVAAAVRAQLSDRARAEAMAERAARHIEAFSAEKMRADLARLWLQVAGVESAPAPDFESG